MMIDFATRFLLLIALICSVGCQSNNKELPAAERSSPDRPKPVIPVKMDSLQQRYVNLEIEELFWQNRLGMSRDASIDLAVDLIDSMVYLDIKGVPLRKSRISRYEFSTSLGYLKWQLAYKTWLATPFHLRQDSVSTIPKEPVFVKDLSTQPLEAFDDWTYFNRLEKEGPVHFRLVYDRGLTVQVDQDSGTVFTEDSLFSINPSGHWIKLNLPADDAKAIYRALAIPSELSLRY